MSTGTVVLVGTALFAVGCSQGGTGLRDGGPARSETAKSAPTPGPGAASVPSSQGPVKRVDAVALLKADPKVSGAVKRDLKPCAGKDFPVDVSYGKITDNGTDDVVVNVLSCADAIGVGTYVYRADGGRYVNVFADEQPPVYAEIDRGALVLTKQVYAKSDALTFPSGEDVITYHWSGEKFTEQDRVHTDYSNVVDGGPAPTAVATPKG
ncbi:hypothetical protein ACN20G_14015 [Streptomyces sp. BI20]|uniref:hypothetical protein n=1 Tax=Streptomyces sp. BI20 TaxID=3403460 RepID=UPI003C735387